MEGATIGQPLNICFVALRAYHALTGDVNVRHIGGAEVQQVIIGRGLARSGHCVSFITQDHGQPDAVEAEGITIYKSYRSDAGVRFLRFAHPRVTSIWSAMKRANADIYYQRTSDSTTGVVAAFCRSAGRAFVFSVGHDGDCIPELPFCSTLRERVLYRYGLKHAHAVVAQTDSQRRNLSIHFGVESSVIRSCAVCEACPQRPVECGPENVIWVGRFAPEKRPLLLLDVAEQCPGVVFDVMGDSPDSRLVFEFKERAKLAANVHMHGFVPNHEIARHYDSATALINTSHWEGFPNTFLEAWSRGVPVVTSVDPDGVVTANRLGLFGETADELATQVRNICDDPELRRTLSKNAEAHFNKYHRVDKTIDCYCKLFSKLHRPDNRGALLGNASLHQKGGD